MNIVRGQKTRSLRKLYEKNEEVDQVSNVAFIACDLVDVDDVVKNDVWIKAMDEEIDAMERNSTWDLVDLPDNKNCIGVKWIYKTKLNGDSDVEKYKARLVAQGFSQQTGIDYTENFAPASILDTVRTILAIVSHNKWYVHQMDVISTFLNGSLEEEVYVRQPPGYEIDGQEYKVYRLKKALYGLK